MLNKNLDKYNQIWNRINESNTITLFTHVNPDGDTIGCSVALKKLIELNTNAEVKISGDKYPYNLDFLESNDDVSDEYIKESLAIAVDASSIKRIFDKRILTAKEILKIDHHHPEGNEWSIAIEGDDYPATGEILWEMINHLGLKFNKEIAEAIFVSIWTDTSGMVERHPTDNTRNALDWSIENGSSKEEMISKLNLSDEDMKIVESIVSKTIVEDNIALLINKDEIETDIYRTITERLFKDFDAKVYVFITNIDNGYIRVGLRSKTIDVSKVAEQYNGGGHVTSAGCKIDSFDEVDKLMTDIRNMMK